MKNEHGYAKQYLSQTNFDIRIGGKSILTYDGNPNWSIPKQFSTEVMIGQSLVEELGNIKILTSYSDIINLGFVLVSRHADEIEKTFFGQKTILELCRREMNVKDVGRVPEGHYVEWNVPQKCIRLIGRNAGLPGRINHGKWISLNPNANRERNIVYDRPVEDYLDIDKVDNILDRIQGTWCPAEDEPEYMYIPEVVVMISETNEIVCIEHESRDPPVFGIIGERGGGKTLCMHTITDQIFNKTTNYEDPSS